MDEELDDDTDDVDEEAEDTVDDEADVEADDATEDEDELRRMPIFSARSSKKRRLCLGKIIVWSKCIRVAGFGLMSPGTWRLEFAGRV